MSAFGMAHSSQVLPFASVTVSQTAQLLKMTVGSSSVGVHVKHDSLASSIDWVHMGQSEKTVSWSSPALVQTVHMLPQGVCRSSQIAQSEKTVSWSLFAFVQTVHMIPDGFSWSTHTGQSENTVSDASS